MQKRKKLSQETLSELTEVMLKNIEKGKDVHLLEVVGIEQEELTNQLKKCNRIVGNHVAEAYVANKGKLDALNTLKEMLEENIHPLLAFVYTYQANSVFNTDEESVNTVELGSYNKPSS